MLFLDKPKIFGPMPIENSCTVIPDSLAVIKWPNSWTNMRTQKINIAHIAVNKIDHLKAYISAPYSLAHKSAFITSVIEMLCFTV